LLFALLLQTPPQALPPPMPRPLMAEEIGQEQPTIKSVDGALILTRSGVEGVVDTSEVPLALYGPALRTVCYVIANGNQDGTLLLRAKALTRSVAPRTETTICRADLEPFVANNRVDLVFLLRKGTDPPVLVNTVTFSIKAPPALPILEPRLDGNIYVVEVPLDRTGVADWRLLNPRRTYVLCTTFDPAVYQKTKRCAVTGSDVFLRFKSRVGDRAFVVTFTDIASSKRNAFVEAGFRVSCSGGKCEAALQVDPNSPQGLPVTALVQAYVAADKAATPVKFTVAFFDEEAELSNPQGMFSLVEGGVPSEPPGGSAWSVTANADAAHDLDLSGLVPACPSGTSPCPTDPVVSLDSPRASGNRTHLAGTVRLALRQTLGNRANAEVEIQVKKADLGGEEGLPTARATKYRLNIFATHGVTFSGGRYVFTSPSRSIALNEAGEGLTAAFRGFDASYLFKKEVPDDRIRRQLLGLDPGATGVDSGDHWTAIVQYRDLKLVSSGSLLLNSVAVFGNEEVRGIDNPYSTIGGEFFYAVPTEASAGVHVTGSVAAYVSRRRADEIAPGAADRDDRRGMVWISTTTLTNLGGTAEGDKKPTNYTLSVTLARGSGDDPDTPRREDYIGPSSTFTPDLIFLNVLAGAVSPDPGLDGRVGKSLSNKMYFGVAYNDQRFSALAFLARRFGTPAGDILGKGTAFKWHYYRFNKPVFGEHAAGSEFSVETRVEAPKGLKYSFSFGVFQPGSALERVITKPQWTLLANLSVKL
jgi:hypothetical protein